MGNFIGLAAAALGLISMPAGAEQVRFDSAARNTQAVQVFQGKTTYSDAIYGELQLPSRGAAPFPAMVIMHSSRGVVATIRDWASLFNDMGIATFAVDSFTPRGLTESSAGRFSFPADVVDSLRALQALRQDPRIDSRNIGVIGFSLGAIGAMDSSFERYRTAVLGADGGRFALHIVFYGGCAQYAKTTGSPILTFVGSEDDFVNPGLCRRHAEILNRQGTRAELVVYPGAPHGFDTDYPLEWMPTVRNFRNCAMLQNLDTFEATLADGRVLGADERVRYSNNCPGYGASRGGDRRYAPAARERVRSFVAEHFRLRAAGAGP